MKYSGFRHANKLWYHGRRVLSTEFSYDFVGRKDAHDQEGPGFYFTRSQQDACHYATGGTTEGIVIVAALRFEKQVPLQALPSLSMIRKLVLASPDPHRVAAEYWDAPVAAVIPNYGNEETLLNAFLAVWHDFYDVLGQGRLYLENLVKLFGYDGHLSPTTPDHAVVYNPKIIHIQRVIRYGYPSGNACTQ